MSNEPIGLVTYKHEQKLKKVFGEPSSCSCEGCKSMCKASPCVPTPEEVMLIIQMDEYAAPEKVAFTTVIVEPLGYIQECVMPMPVKDTSSPTGERCVFLNNHDLCDLHEKGLKPMEGRFAMHGRSEMESALMRKIVLDSWKSKLGKLILSQNPNKQNAL